MHNGEDYTEVVEYIIFQSDAHVEGELAPSTISLFPQAGLSYSYNSLVILDMYYKRTEEFFDKVITHDEDWVHFNQETKTQSKK